MGAVSGLAPGSLTQSELNTSVIAWHPNTSHISRHTSFCWSKGITIKHWNKTIWSNHDVYARFWVFSFWHNLKDRLKIKYPQSTIFYLTTFIMSEKLRLKWNDYKSSWNRSLSNYAMTMILKMEVEFFSHKSYFHPAQTITICEIRNSGLNIL